MLDTLLSPGLAPFTLALALLFGLLALEVVALLIGGSLMGAGAEADMDIELGDIGDLPGVDLDGLDLDPGDFDLAGAEDIEVAVPQAAPNPLSWLGLGRMPMLLWLATLCLSFGVGGLVLQSLAGAVFGGPLLPVLAILPVAIFAFWFTGRFGALFARLLPKTESEVVTANQLARRRGTVTQGIAARGRPAEVRVTDRYGNTHYLRAEPLADDAEIAEGASILVLRHRPTGSYRLLPLTD